MLKSNKQQFLFRARSAGSLKLIRTLSWGGGNKIDSKLIPNNGRLKECEFFVSITILDFFMRATEINPPFGSTQIFAFISY